MKEINKTNNQSLNRISRIEGQLKGVRKMIVEKKDCTDIITQVMAIKEAVSSLGVEILKDDLVCNRKKLSNLDEKYLKSLFKFK